MSEHDEARAKHLCDWAFDSKVNGLFPWIQLRYEVSKALTDARRDERIKTLTECLMALSKLKPLEPQHQYGINQAWHCLSALLPDDAKEARATLCGL